MKAAYVLLLIVMVGFVSAGDEQVGNQPIDTVDDACDWSYFGFVCDTWSKLKDTSNKLTSDEVDSILSGSNTVKDTEIAILESKVENSKERLYFNLDTIVSLLVLILEVLKTIFILVQLFIIFHLPYFYLKFINYVVDLTVRSMSK